MTLDLTPLAQALAPAVAEAVAAMLSEQAAPTADGRAIPGSDLDLWRAYSAKEVGERLGLSPDAVYHIPEDRLPRTYVGGAGGRRRYLGIHVLCYMAGLDGVDVGAIAEKLRRRFIESAAPPAAVRPMRPSSPAHGTQPGALPSDATRIRIR